MISDPRTRFLIIFYYPTIPPSVRAYAVLAVCAYFAVPLWRGRFRLNTLFCIFP